MTTDDIKAMASWVENRTSEREIAYRPARVLMQDFTGVPAVVDLAAMREAMAKMGGDPRFWNSLALIGGEQTYFLGASSSDAKGQPVQLNAVSHGCPIALFRNVNILNTA